VKKSKLNVFAWVAILPQIAELVGDVVSALKDGRIDGEEAKSIGERLVAIVAAVVDHA
jgi:hypothetical protein